MRGSARILTLAGALTCALALPASAQTGTELTVYDPNSPAVREYQQRAMDQWKTTIDRTVSNNATSRNLSLADPRARATTNAILDLLDQNAITRTAGQAAGGAVRIGSVLLPRAIAAAEVGGAYAGVAMIAWDAGKELRLYLGPLGLPCFMFVCGTTKGNLVKVTDGNGNVPPAQEDTPPNAPALVQGQPALRTDEIVGGSTCYATTMDMLSFCATQTTANYYRKNNINYATGSTTTQAEAAKWGYRWCRSGTSDLYCGAAKYGALPTLDAQRNPPSDGPYFGGRVYTATSPYNCASGYWSNGAGGSNPCVAAPAPTSLTAGGSAAGYGTFDTIHDAMASNVTAKGKMAAATVATIIQSVWKEAAQKPGYKGLPYDDTRPVTPEQATQAVPGDSTSPIPDAASVTFPYGSVDTAKVPNSGTGATTQTSGPYTSPAGGASPAGGTSSNTGTNSAPTTTTSTSTTTTNPDGTTTTTTTTPNTQVNLGPDPGIGAPDMGDGSNVPKAANILAPLTAMFPGLKGWQPASRGAACPTWGPLYVDYFKGSIPKIDAHCPLLEGARGIIATACMLAWTILGVRTFLSA